MMTRKRAEEIAAAVFDEAGTLDVYGWKQKLAADVAERYAGEIVADVLTVIERVRREWCDNAAASIEDCHAPEHDPCQACAMVREIRDALRSREGE